MAERACRECGCTWKRACPGGCWWAPDHPDGGALCSTCARRLGLPTDAPLARNLAELEAQIDAGVYPYERSPDLDDENDGYPSWCSWCGGDAIQECDDPIQCCDPDCDGEVGLARHQVVW